MIPHIVIYINVIVHPEKECFCNTYTIPIFIGKDTLDIPSTVNNHIQKMQICIFLFLFTIPVAATASVHKAFPFFPTTPFSGSAFLLRPLKLSLKQRTFHIN